ncbi:MAG: electron transfer flavoprotein subunit beta/FixA family protein, partial [Gammaproteobacteria bacterium]|nr:electron transfer flavoprotein subunit beta/FixA family protein [Gammaproteobacteria bacterium]
MKVLVAIKRAIDYRVRVQVKPDGSGVVTDGVKFGTNPFDEIAIEEALRLREAGHAKEVIACSIGSDTVQTELRSALAMGADRAIWVNSEDSDLQPLTIAHTLHAIAKQEQPDLIILGKQAIDGDNNQCGQMLAILSQRPQATFVSK